MPDSSKNLYKKLLGMKGEKQAQRYLKSKGYTVLDANYTTYYGEADVVAVKDGTLVFVEVKTRTGDKFGRPCEAVDAKKQSRYRRIAECYVYEKNLNDVQIRFDVIEINGGEINHIEDAF